jgi:multidrug efflux pump subunit AcrB
MPTADVSETTAIERRIRKKATRRVYARIGLMWHAAVFLMANVAMYAINQRYTPTATWFVWPLAGWGAALAMHAFATFSSGGMTEEMIQLQIQREKQRRGLA